MNAAERRKYQKEYSLVNRKFTKKYYPKVLKAVSELVSSLIENIRVGSVRSAMIELSTTLINDKLFKPIESLYKEVGLFHAKRNYRLIRAEINQKGMGRNEIWLQEIINYLQRNLLQFAVIKPTETLRDALMKILEDAVNSGMSESEVIQMIKDSNLAVIQAQRIVRTEINRAANSGIKVSAESFGFQMSKEWIAHRDVRTRGFNPEDKKDHYHLDGQVVGLNDKFTDPRSGEQIDHPSAPEGSAGMVINCRCTYATVPKRDERGRLIKR